MERNYVYLSGPDQALTVIAGVATADCLHLWHLQVLQVMALALLALSVIAWCTWLVYQAWVRESSHAQTLARQGQRLQALLRTASDGTHVLDSRGTLVEVGDTFLTLLGYRRTQLIGRSMSLWLPGFSQRHVQVWTRMLDRRPHLRREARFRRADGQQVCVEIYAAKTTLDGQELDGLVNEQKAMLDNDLIGIVKLVDRKVEWMNRGVTRIFDFEQGELVGPSIRKLYADEASYIRVGGQAYSELSDRGRYRTEIQMRHKNGNILWIKAFGSYLAGRDGESLWLIQDVTQAHPLFEKIEAPAYHDGLTGLPNRRMMTDRLETAIANRSQKRAGDTVSRTWGDEFVLTLNPLGTKPDHEQVLNRILASVRQPFALGNGTEVSVGASIGVSFFPDHANTADMLPRQADQAMYEAKAHGRGRICVKARPNPPPL